jgi:hypothetical protein
MKEENYGLNLPEGIPIIEFTPGKEEEFRKNLDFALWSTGGSSDYRNDRGRPYNGQPHTDQGERGKTLVEGLTMRDICDCFVMGWLDASMQHDKIERGTWRYQDVYKDCSVDPIAVKQNMACHIERMMGVFPNVPTCKQESSDES